MTKVGPCGVRGCSCNDPETVLGWLWLRLKSLACNVASVVLIGAAVIKG